MPLKLLSVLVSIAITLILSFFPELDTVKYIFDRFAYYYIFISFVIWVTLISIQYGQNFSAFAKSHIHGILLSLILIVIIVNVSPPQFKILLDESNLIGTSMAMYENKTVSLPLQGLDFDDAKQTSNLYLDKRPLLFPFLSSLVHNLNGYKETNGLILNFFIGFCILFLLYLLSNLFFKKNISLLSILLLASLPNFSFWVTSSGFEALNLLFILLSFVFLYAFCYKPTIINLEIIVITIALLMQCRYESILFGIALFFVLPYLTNKNLINSIRLNSLFLPIFFLPVIWQRRLFWNDDKSYAAVIGKTITAPESFDMFSLKNALANLPDNIFVMLGIDPTFGFSPVIIFFAILGCYLLVKKILLLQKTISLPQKCIICYGILSFVIISILINSYFYGNMTKIISNRFALVFLPYIVLPAIYFLSEFSKFNPSKIRIISFIFLISLFTYNLTYAAKQELIKNMALQQEFYKVTSLISSLYPQDEKILVISDEPSLYFIKKYGSVSYKYANEHKEKIRDSYLLKFDHIIAIQKFLFLNNSLFHRTRLEDNAHVFKEIQTIPLTPFTYIRVSEIHIPSIKQSRETGKNKLLN